VIDLNDPVVRGYLLQLLGEEGIKIIENMPEGEVTDEAIAEATEVLLNIVRRNLFIMNENKLAVCRRERDSSSGWLTYLWKLDLDDINNQLSKEQRKLIKNLQTRLDFEEGNVFYVCPEGHIRVLFNDAADLEFLCPMCGEDLEFQDNQIIVDALKKRLDALAES